MVRWVSVLRFLAVLLVSPVILISIAIACLLHPVDTARRPLQRPRRLAMSVADWVQGVPVGYSYWVRYEAAAMLDEIEVHHEDAS